MRLLTKKEFDLLSLLSTLESDCSQRELSERLGCSLGTINSALRDLSAAGCCEDKRITPKGLEALEPYRVRRAVFIAAGFGARLVPITLNTPKPLVRVNGTRIIDTMLDAIVQAGIEEIVIVRGYLGEQFDQLLYKYPKIKFVENPIFNESNNISSALCVRYLFQNAYILDADLYLRNPALIRKYEYQSYMLGIPVERTDDWCVTTDRNGNVASMALGGVDGYREVGISYWTAEDGAKLAMDLDEVYRSPGGKERFWEEVPFVYRKRNYQVKVQECAPGDIAEVDTLSDLRSLDKAYN